MTKQNLTLKDLTRRQIRYICFRLQTAAEGGAKVDESEGGIMELAWQIKDHMESQEDFGGWAKFARTWDVDDKAPLVAILRTHSIQTEWNKILKEETKVIPVQTQEEINTAKEERRKFLLDLQATLARERITRLSDIERRLEELDR
ncbi:MAG: hypothetical protein AAB546_01545 [Patescibacteria group bacterium]